MAKKVTHKKDMHKKQWKIVHKEKSNKPVDKIEAEWNKTLANNEKKMSDAQLRKRYIEELKKKERQCPIKIKYTKPWQPTKFEDRFADEMLKHFQDHIADWYYEEYVEETLNAFWQPVDQVKRRAKAIPMFETYALSIGVAHDTLLNWAVAKGPDGKLLHREFFVSYKKCLWIQSQMLKALWMKGDYVSNIVKLLLSAEHGIYEIKEENDNTDKWKKLSDINSMNIDDNLQDVLS